MPSVNLSYVTVYGEVFPGTPPHQRIQKVKEGRRFIHPPLEKTNHEALDTLLSGCGITQIHIQLYAPPKISQLPSPKITVPENMRFLRKKTFLHDWLARLIEASSLYDPKTQTSELNILASLKPAEAYLYLPEDFVRGVNVPNVLGGF